MINPYASVDLYCERLDAGIWAEPLNALSNAGFLLAAWWLWRRSFPRDVEPEVRRLAALIALIGLGSALFHIFGRQWGIWLDVGFIALFILAFIHRYLRRLAQRPHWQCWLGIVVFAAADRLIAALGSLGLNGSEGYVLPGMVLIACALWARRLAPSASPWLWCAVFGFAISITLRTLDMAWCATWSSGTHFGWHLLNALVLYCCVRGLAAGCRDVR